MIESFSALNFFASNPILNTYKMVSSNTEALLEILFRESGVTIPSNKSYFRRICYLWQYFFSSLNNFSQNLIFNVIVTAYKFVITLKHGINACSGFVSKVKKNIISCYFTKILENHC